MRAPRRKRPLKREVATSHEGIDLDQLAQRVRYVGSPEHKNTPSFAGQPRPRADASICGPELAHEQERVTLWLRGSIRRGAISSLREGDSPRYAWHKEGEIVYEARLVNRAIGAYKGYPLNDTEWPKGLESAR